MRNSLLDIRRALSKSKRVVRFLHHFATGKGAAAGNSAQFTRANSESLSIADNTSVSTGDIDFTIAVWVRLDNISNGFGIISKYDTAAQREYLLSYNTGSTSFLLTVSSDGTSPNQTFTGAALPVPAAGTWYLVTCWHDATANEIGLKVNTGAAVTAAHTTGVFDGTAPFVMGDYTAPGTFFLDGRLAKAGLWKGRVLTDADIAELYNDSYGLRHSELSSGLLTSLESYWDLEESSGTRSDSEGSNNLTDNNTVTQGNGPPLR